MSAAHFNEPVPGDHGSLPERLPIGKPVESKVPLCLPNSLQFTRGHYANTLGLRDPLLGTANCSCQTSRPSNVQILISSLCPLTWRFNRFSISPRLAIFDIRNRQESVASPTPSAPRNQVSIGTRKPAFFLSMISLGSRPSATRFTTHFVEPRLNLMLDEARRPARLDGDLRMAAAVALGTQPLTTYRSPRSRRVIRQPRMAVPRTAFA